MARKTREEIIKEYKEYEVFDRDWEEFYNLPHEKKANPEIFEAFCKKTSGQVVITLSDDEICDNIELVKIADKYNIFRNFHLLSPRILSDPEMALLLADCDKRQYTSISKELRSDPELMYKALQINTGIYCSLPVKVRINKKILQLIAEKHPWELSQLKTIRKEYRDKVFSDKELALLVAKNHPEYVDEYFYPEVLKDEEVLETIFKVSDPVECVKRLKKHTWGLKYIDPKYWSNDKVLVKNALKENGMLYEYLPENFRKDKQLAILAVKQDYRALKFCSEELLDDRDVIWAALTEESEEVLSYASGRLCADYDLVYKAVKVDSLNLMYASDELRDNRDIVLQAVKTYGGVLEDASERLQKDEELIRIAEKNL